MFILRCLYLYDLCSYYKYYFLFFFRVFNVDEKMNYFICIVLFVFYFCNFDKYRREFKLLGFDFLIMLKVYLKNIKKLNFLNLIKIWILSGLFI